MFTNNALYALSSLCRKNEVHISNNSSKFTIKYAGYACLSLITITLSFFSLLDYAADVLTLQKATLCLLLALTLFVFGVKLLQDNSQSVSRSFIIVGLPALLMFSWFILPDQVPDEVWHIYRSLNLGWHGGPTLDVPDLLTFQHMPLNYLDYRNALQVQDAWSHMHTVDRTLSGYYSHLYLFSGLLAEIGKVIRANPLIVVWMARMGNACMYLVAGYLALKIIPIGKTIAFLYFLNPMLLELEASCSADAVLNMASGLFIALYLRTLLKEVPTKRDFILLASSFLLTALSKQAYVLLGGLYIGFIWKYPNKRFLKVLTGIVISICLICAVVVLYVYPNGVDSELGYAIDLVRQPGLFISVIVKTVWERLPFWISSFAGGALGAFTVSTWEPCFWGYLIALAVSVVYNEGDDRQLLVEQKAFLIIFSFALVIVLTLPFRAWSIKVDGRADIIQGVQGRYYLPFMLLPLVCLINPSSQVHSKKCYFNYGLFMVVDLFIIMLSIIQAFY